MMKLNDRQKRALKAGTFHFDSGGDNAALMSEVDEMARAGLIKIETAQYSQHAVYTCRVTEAGQLAAAKE